MSATKEPIAETRYGRLKGTWVDDVAVFRNVPYAAAPVGNLRFRPAEPPPCWDGERSAESDGPIPPQSPSRVSAVLGSFSYAHGEDCLSLTIYSVQPCTAPRPVMVWIHGGAFQTGAGSLSWYSGATMARRGDVVVVGVNYRLGALGFLHVPGFNEANIGILDQITALEWITANIAAFGGDPNNVTIFGESAGGLCVLALLGVPRVRSCFRRVIAQSPAFGIEPRPVAEAATLGKRLVLLLGLAGTEELRSVGISDILQAQTQLIAEEYRFADISPPFVPVADGNLLGSSLIPAAIPGALDHDLMIGYTKNEFSTYVAIDHRLKQAEMSEVDEVFGRFFGAAALEARNFYSQRVKTNRPSDILEVLMTDSVFVVQLHAFVERVAALGHPAFVYQFEWAPHGNPLRACHGIELPFVFNNFSDWDAPMLDGGEPAEMEAIAEEMQDSWIAFARQGDPNHPGVPMWPRFDAQERMTMCFNAVTRVRSDPTEYSTWRYLP